jgi:hypothetical protein
VKVKIQDLQNQAVGISEKAKVEKDELNSQIASEQEKFNVPCHVSFFFQISDFLG